jgi:hypothetical protein
VLLFDHESFPARLGGALGETDRRFGFSVGPSAHPDPRVALAWPRVTSDCLHELFCHMDEAEQLFLLPADNLALLH